MPGREAIKVPAAPNSVSPVLNQSPCTATAAVAAVCRNYTHLPVTSASLPVDCGGRYDAFPHFVGFAERIKFAGGINKPKIVTATDSEGRRHRQLVRPEGWVNAAVASGQCMHTCIRLFRPPTAICAASCLLCCCCLLQVKSGNDDLRQDAVMQQFFWLVNQLLRQQPRTQRRNLFVRTYKVRAFGREGEDVSGGGGWGRQCSAGGSAVRLLL